MRLLSENDLVFIRNSVEKLSDSSCYLWVTLTAFCEKAKEWLEQHPHSNVDDSKITSLRDHFV
ncbi:hypothetical protein A2U01_0110905, partial [Trifolium medium]|nr:hypothetical protein [Trifolium medium]